MDERNKQLLSKVTEERLNRALNPDGEPEVTSVAFGQAMEAIDRQIELEKIEAAQIEQIRKQRREFAIRCVEIGVAMLAVPTIKYVFNRNLLKTTMIWEDDHTFTTSGGKTLSRALFDFK